MESTKQEFQNQLAEWEDKLVNYKTSFPKNFGAMVRNNLHNLVMLFGLFMCFDYFRGMATYPMCGLAPVVLLFGVMLERKYHKHQVTSPENQAISRLKYLRGIIDTAKQTYAEYPDANMLLQKLEQSLNAEVKRKSNIKLVYRIIVWAVFLVYGWQVGTAFYDNMQDQLRNYDAYDSYCNILELSSNNPIVVLKPLRNDITDKLTLQSNFLYVYLDFSTDHNLDTRRGHTMRYLRASRPVMSGSGSKGYFRLRITDEDGKPLARCPGFVFLGDDYGTIKSRYFSYSPDFEQNGLLTLETLHYIQANQEHLRFLVEKI